MRAVILQQPKTSLSLAEVPTPTPAPGQLLLKVTACAICRTDLHVIDGDLPSPKLPLILGHEIVGLVAATGPNTQQFEVGQRVGVPWLGSTCGQCRYCHSQKENLCPDAQFIGYTLDGGFAEYTIADERFCFPIPHAYNDAEAAPLLCAGLIGYRSFAKVREAKRVGIFGFGAAAHIITQVAVHLGVDIYAFTRPGDFKAQAFARSLGACWAGAASERPPQLLDAAIIFAPVGELVPAALQCVGKGGTVVCGGIHMTDIPSFPYSLLWEERSLTSVANLTRQDGNDFMQLAAGLPIRTHVQCFPLEEANKAITALRTGKISGAAVLVP